MSVVDENFLQKNNTLHPSPRPQSLTHLSLESWAPETAGVDRAVEKRVSDPSVEKGDTGGEEVH